MPVKGVLIPGFQEEKRGLGSAQNVSLLGGMFLKLKRKTGIYNKMGRVKKRIPNLRNIKLWNKLVEEVFNHKASKYSIFVYEMIKRRILGTKGFDYRATDTLDKKYGVKNIK
ncbi:hypothetical protein LCGC14_2047720 [marine sediment metagenome]|uniref:Uncharacterized protein n=1 Tax=marine sediment metagenome TaxID=412755 RepID=A0A0F9H3D9_9ZZZZ